MPSYVTPKKNTQYIFYVSLVSQASTLVFQSNPTIAAGDFQVSTDGGALANLGTLPTVNPASSKLVEITLSAAEMNGDNIQIIGSDQAGAEWCDIMINIQTSAQQIDDVLGANSITEPSGVPSFPMSGQSMLGRLAAALVNKVTTTASAKTFFNSSNAAQYSKTVSDDGTTYTETKGA